MMKQTPYIPTSFPLSLVFAPFELVSSSITHALFPTYIQDTASPNSTLFVLTTYHCYTCVSTSLLPSQTPTLHQCPYILLEEIGNLVQFVNRKTAETVHFTLLESILTAEGGRKAMQDLVEEHGNLGNRDCKEWSKYLLSTLRSEPCFGTQMEYVALLCFACRLSAWLLACLLLLDLCRNVY